MARAAITAGISTFGFSEHAPLFAHAEDHPLPGTQMARSHWPEYLQEAAEVRHSLQRELDIRIGTEADWLPGTADVYREALAAAPLDYVLGSVHDVGPVHIYKRDTHHLVEDANQLHHDYWRLTREAVQSGLFDILAHMDAVKARLPKPDEDMGAEIEETLDCIADLGVAVEMNTAGLRKTDELFPSPAILAGLVRRDVPLTFGSDSHRVSEVGFGWGAARAELDRLGVRKIVAFRERRPEWVRL